MFYCRGQAPHAPPSSLLRRPTIALGRRLDRRRLHRRPLRLLGLFPLVNRPPGPAHGALPNPHVERQVGINPLCVGLGGVHVHRPLLVDRRQVLLHLDRRWVPEQHPARLHDVVVDAVRQQLDLFDHIGHHAELEEAVVRLRPEALVLHVGLPRTPGPARGWVFFETRARIGA